ncbi:MAG: mannosyltransferase family protein [Myxococcaceae bacterium]
MDLLKVAKRFAGLAALCLVAGTLTLWLQGPSGVGARHSLFAEYPWLHMWIRWDAGWYQAIAENGYSFSTTEQSPAAFFPLYPTLMRGLVLLGINPFLAGMGITVVCGLFAIFTFSRWASTLAGPEDVDRATWLLVLWPFAYYLVGAVYSDALFLLLITGSFWILEKRRVGWATLLGALATATRPVAPAVVVGLLLREWELERREGKPPGVRTLLPALSCVGLLAYMGFLWWRFDDPLAFLHAQTAWRQTPGPTAWFKLALFQNVHHPDELLIPLVHAVLSITLLGLAWRVWKTLGLGYAAYVVIALGIPLISSRDFIGLGRYCLAAFPSLLALSTALGTRPRWAAAWMAGSGALLVYMVHRFAMGSYIS